LFDGEVFLQVLLEVAVFVALTPGVGHFLVPVAGGDGALVGVAILAVEAFDLGPHFFGGPGGFAVAFLGGLGGIVFLEGFELADQAQPGVAEMALVSGVGEEGVGGGILVEGFGEGEAGRVVVFLAEVVELAFGVVGALEFPEDGAGLVEEVELEGIGGVEGLAQLLDEDVVGGGAFVLEAGGLGAEAVFEGVLGGNLFAPGRFGTR